jgi:hypothetical protein
MKTITMTLDEYNADIKRAKEGQRVCRSREVQATGRFGLGDHESGEINAPLNPAFINARYELKPDPKKVEVTAAQLEKAWLGWWGTGPGMEGWLPYLKRELGLEE